MQADELTIADETLVSRGTYDTVGMTKMSIAEMLIQKLNHIVTFAAWSTKMKANSHHA